MSDAMGSQKVDQLISTVMSIANTLRGTYTSDKYRDVIIPMTILRRIECSLEKTKGEVLRAYEANKDTPDLILQKKSGYPFYNTSGYTLGSLLSDPLHLDRNLKTYIGAFSQNIQGIMKELEFDTQIKKMKKGSCLVGTVRKFSELDLSPESVPNQAMDYMFEEIIRRFSENADAGEHYTPREVIRLMTRLTLAEGCEDLSEPNKVIKVADVACGTGGMLSVSEGQLKERFPHSDIYLYGQENNPESHAICLADMLIKGQRADRIRFADTMKEDCFPKDSFRFELIYNFCYIEKKRDRKTHKVVGRQMIFPRYHQLRAVRSISHDVARNGTLRNYLVEHSAGSGKTKTICWLAHKLQEMHRKGGPQLYFDKVLIVTDRRVVDDQLQGAALDMAKDPAIVRVMDKGKTSADLGKALHSNYRIVVTTMAKFLYLDPGTFSGEGRRFAVLVDEAHGSTSGKTMEAINGTLSDAEEESTLERAEAFLRTDAARRGRQGNVTLIGFTATPTARTLELFGTLNARGKHEAFDLYSMREAVEEGFILNVTSNYTTYDTYCKVRKTIENDPTLETRAARRQMLYMRQASELGIEEKLEVMAEHFTGTVRGELGGRAKAMVVASSRLAAVRYFLAYERLRQQNSDTLGDIRALVAFTDDVEDGGRKYTEAGLNGIPESQTADAFDTDDYRILIVADKFQTGFDQPYLAAMYVDKPLSGVAAVQTLSRLNRICKPYDKQTFVLDFVNDYDTIRGSFAPYYESTVLERDLTMDDVRETERRLLGLGVLDDEEVEEYNGLLSKRALQSRDRERMLAILSSAKERVKGLGPDAADEARRVMRAFVRQYSFMLQVAPFVNTRMHSEYNFCSALLHMLRDEGGIRTYVLNKVTIEDFEVSDEGKTHEGEGLSAKPGMRVAVGTGTGLTESQYERLSRIVADWNARYGKHFDAAIAAGSLVSLKGKLESNPKIIRSAKVNTKRDFRNTVEDETDEALAESYEQNEDWFGFLLNNKEARSELLRAFVDDIYEVARRGDDD